MTDMNLLGRTIGRFEILSELGRGGMAVVYRARQIDLERVIALKVLPPAFSLDKSYSDRFMLEARSAAALEHPHIVPIYEVGTAEGFQYIAMKYIAGRTLKDIVQEHGALDVQQTATYLEQVADALDYAHTAGVIHRDIKPSNIMVAQNGWVYLTDFGLARGTAPSGLTMTGTVMGTPEYMSPEQAQGLSTIGPSTDIYSLGVVLYEMLTGNMPFQADTPMGMLVARLQYAPRPPRDYRGDLPLPVEDVIMRALARRPDARYAKASELIAALKQAAGVHTHIPSLHKASPPQGTHQPDRANTPRASSTPPPPVNQPPQLPPTQPIGGRAATPPYVMPAQSHQGTASRGATPPPPVMRASGAGAVTKPTGGAEQRQASEGGRSRWRLPLIAGVALIVVIALIGGAFVISRGRNTARVDQLLQQAQAQLSHKGEVDQAIKTYQSVLSVDSKNVLAHTRLSLIYNLRSHYIDAEKEARAAITIDPRAPFAQAMLAEALNNQGRRDEALVAAERAVSLDSKGSIGYSVRAPIKADNAVESSDKDLLADAISDADQALATSNDEDNLAKALAHSARGYVYWQQYSLEGDTAAVNRGIEEFNQAIGLQGQFAVFHSNLGYFYDAQAEHDHAREKFEAALDTDPQYSHAHTGLGWNLYYLNDYEGALNEFDAAIALNAEDTDAYIGKSRVFLYRSEPDYDQAIDVLNQAVGISPKSPNILSNLGWAHRAKAVSLDYASDEQQQHYREAEEVFRRALEVNSGYVDALTGLGWALRDQAAVRQDDALFDQAIEILHTSLEIKEEQSNAHNALGWSYYGLKEYSDSVEEFDRAIELQADYADAYYGKGQALEADGKTAEAKAAYQSAVDHGSTYAKDALERLK